MAYFECTIGGASGDGVALIIECDASFAGSVITADNGEDSFSDTCPSVAPYTVKFDGIPTGTYTISGVSGGVTITKQYTVLDYTASLHVIPNGATVTPINDIQIWLHCANIWDKTYTSIAQVLADASTLQALIANNNAVNYMARSTSWASSVTANANAMTYIGNNNYCANKLLAGTKWLNAICNSAYFESVLNVKVPTMTSNTTPSGVASVSSRYSTTYEAWKAFNGTLIDQNDCWHSYGGAVVNSYLRYQATSAFKCHKVTLQNRRGANNADIFAVNTFKIQGSNDGATWADLTNVLTNTNKGTARLSEYVVNSNTAYLYHQILVLTSWNSQGTAVSNEYVAIGELQFYGRA